MAGYIAYLEYSYSNDKGQTHNGDLIANPFGFGKVDVDYSSARVVENVDSAGGVLFAWGPAYPHSVAAFVNGAWTEVSEDNLETDDDGKIIGISEDSFDAGTKVRYIYDNIAVPQEKLPTIKAEMKSKALIAKARRIAVNRNAA